MDQNQVKKFRVIYTLSIFFFKHVTLNIEGYQFECRP